MREVKDYVRDKQLQRAHSFRKGLLPLLQESSPKHLINYLALSDIPGVDKLSAIQLDKPHLELPCLLFLAEKHPELKPKIEQKVLGWLRFKGKSLRKELVPFVSKLVEVTEESVLRMEKCNEGEKQVYSQLIFLHLKARPQSAIARPLFFLLLRAFCPYQRFLQSVEMVLDKIDFETVLKHQAVLLKQLMNYSNLQNQQRGYTIKAELCLLLLKLATLYQSNFHIIFKLPINQAKFILNKFTSSTITYLRNAALSALSQWKGTEAKYLLFQNQKGIRKLDMDPFRYDWASQVKLEAKALNSMAEIRHRTSNKPARRKQKEDHRNLIEQGRAKQLLARRQIKQQVQRIGQTREQPISSPHPTEGERLSNTETVSDDQTQYFERDTLPAQMSLYNSKSSGLANSSRNESLFSQIQAKQLMALLSQEHKILRYLNQ